MNYLAHACLSFGEPNILTGNLISDFVKGKKKFDFPAAVQKGITLHRAIDEFTDFHPVTQEAKAYFRKEYRLYSGAFIDVAYDHFLANDVTEFAGCKELDAFCQATYLVLQDNYAVLPDRFLQMLPYMQRQNWLYNYRFRQGIEKSFSGLVRRSAYLSESVIAFNIFNEHYEALGACYRRFFPALKDFAFNKLTNINSN